MSDAEKMRKIRKLPLKLMSSNMLDEVIYETIQQ